MEENPLQRCGISLVPNNKINNKRDEYYNNDEEDDRMSELTGDILVKIVSLLPVKEAAATSILSKRWRFIWTFTKNLNFDAEQTLTDLLNLPNPQDYDRLIIHERLKYIHGVNSVITQLSKNNMFGGIDRFRIKFDLCGRFSSDIDNWIEFAMKNRVQILELELFELNSGRFMVGSNCYGLSKKHFDPVALKSLKVLHLTSVNISGKVVEWLLSNCPLLESLQVVDSLKLTNLRILGAPLKHLEIRGCINIKNVEICDAQNLVSLYYLCFGYDQFLLRNVPKLISVGFKGEHLGGTFTLLSSCLSQLQILHLDLIQLQKHLRNPIYPMLRNLKQLKLTVFASENLNLLLSRITSLLNVSPCLQRLELMISLKGYYDEMCEFLIEPTNCPLKEVEILGYSGTPNHDQLITYFAENLVALQKIVVNPSTFQYYHLAFKPNKDIETIKKEEKVRDHAMQHIKGKIPTTIEFVCL